MNFSEARDGKLRLFCQYHACWCPGSQSHQDSRKHDIDSIGRLTCRVASWWIWSFLLNKSQDMIWHVITAFMIFKKQFSMLRVKYESLILQFFISITLYMSIKIALQGTLKSWVNIGSDCGLVPSGNRPWPDPGLTKIFSTPPYSITLGKRQIRLWGQILSNCNYYDWYLWMTWYFKTLLKPNANFIH